VKETEKEITAEGKVARALKKTWFIGGSVLRPAYPAEISLEFPRKQELARMS
jgi:hypothetical protein